RGVGLLRHRNVIGVIAASPHEAQILEPRHAAPDKGAAAEGSVDRIHSLQFPTVDKRRCQLAAAVVYSHPDALRYDPPAAAEKGVDRDGEGTPLQQPRADSGHMDT